MKERKRRSAEGKEATVHHIAAISLPHVVILLRCIDSVCGCLCEPVTFSSCICKKYIYIDSYIHIDSLHEEISATRYFVSVIFTLAFALSFLFRFIFFFASFHLVYLKWCCLWKCMQNIRIVHFFILVPRFSSFSLFLSQNTLLANCCTLSLIYFRSMILCARNSCFRLFCVSFMIYLKRCIFVSVCE